MAEPLTEGPAPSLTPSPPPPPQSKVAVPLCALYAPARPLPSLPPPLPYEPVRCRGCPAALNPYCSVDFVAKVGAFFDLL